MGYRAYYQPAAYAYPLGDHGLCPYFYNSAFTYDFVPNNFYGSQTYRMANNLTDDVIMGYRGNFNRLEAIPIN